jgi:hypothetical protein
MNPARTSIAATAFACAALFSVAGAQAAADHPHAMKHVAHHHHHHAAEVATEGGEVAAPVAIGGYYQPSEWGDFDCAPSYPGCRPYAAKDWSKP